MFTALPLWLDGSPSRYWAVAWGIFSLAALAAVGAAMPSRRWAWWRHPAVFLGLALLAILAFRWPMMADNRHSIDPDESQMMSGALTLAHDARFWRGVDSSAYGPLAELPLLAPLGLGGRLDYTAARAVAVALGWIGILSAVLIFRHLFGPARGALLALPLFAVNAFTDSFNFVQYESEEAAGALLAAACWLLLASWNSTGRPARPRRLLLAGLALGAAPFAKLQIAPLVVWCAAWGYWRIAADREEGVKTRLRSALEFTAGVAAFPLLFLAILGMKGLWGDFWHAYVVDNGLYAGGRWFSWAQTPAKFVELCGYPGGYGAFLFPCLGLSALGLLGLSAFDRWQRQCAGFALGLAIAAAYAVMVPGRMFTHYLQLLTFPAGLLFGTVAGAALEAIGGYPGRQRRAIRWAAGLAAAAFLACGLAPQVRWRAGSGQPALGRFTETRGRLETSAVSREILRHTRSGDTLGIWGWMPSFWIETGLGQATRDGNSARQIDDTPVRPYYRARYMDDLRFAAPSVIADAVGEGNFSYTVRVASGHETFPELNAYLAARYRLAADLDGTRIYVRNDRP